MIVQQPVVILVFLQEGVRARPSTLPSWLISPTPGRNQGVIQGCSLTWALGPLLSSLVIGKIQLLVTAEPKPQLLESMWPSLQCGSLLLHDKQENL